MNLDIDSWFAGKEFAYDWTSANIPGWLKTLGQLRDRPLRILEVGSYEGRSAVFFLNFFALSTMVCVDWWNPVVIEPEIAKQLPDLDDQFLQAEGRFDRNLAPFGNRVVKLKSNSSDALCDLGLRGQSFDLIYIDGGHRSRDVYQDCVLAWPLLVRDGVMIMDDYEWEFPGLPKDKCPKKGIDAFLLAIHDDYVEIQRGYQIMIKRSRLGLLP
jgi:predicted O-methyltransferase YrrM